jgi:hypothetical protein
MSEAGTTEPAPRSFDAEIDAEIGALIRCYEGLAALDEHDEIEGDNEATEDSRVQLKGVADNITKKLRNELGRRLGDAPSVVADLGRAAAWLARVTFA